MPSEIKTWANTVGQQIENMTVDLVATTAANISEAANDVFFVGRPAQDGQNWILKKITPTELNKMVYNYLTSSSIANQLASVLGGIDCIYNGIMQPDETKTFNTRGFNTLLYIKIESEALFGLLIRNYQKTYLIEKSTSFETKLEISGNGSGRDITVKYLGTSPVTVRIKEL